jgi:hypothetical protein
LSDHRLRHTKRPNLLFDTKNVNKTVLYTISVDKQGLDGSRIEHLLTTGGVTCRPERTYLVRYGGCISRHSPHRSHRNEGIMLTA